MDQGTFVGMQNFNRILTDAKFWEAFMHSVSLSLIVIVLGTWLPFMLALYVYEMRRGSGLLKVLYFIPFLTPAVPAAILWKWMYNQGFGLINSFLSLFVPGSGVHIGWLADSNLVLFSIALVFIWKNTGWAMLIYMAGLHNIPKVLFEDASLNGADVWTKIREIILPALLPVIATVVFMQVINGLQVFTEVYIMTNGGPEGSSEVIASYIYKKAFLYMDIGYASGVAVFFLIILVSVTLLRMNLLNRRRG
jgi:ABC-type sugar transport system permease subunit